MPKKKFDKLNKSELLEVISRMQLQQQATENELEAWKAKAQQRYEALEHAGNIAHAALAIYDVLGTAQKAADDYTAAIRARADEKERLTQTSLAELYAIAISLQAFLSELPRTSPELDTYEARLDGMLQAMQDLGFSLSFSSPGDAL